MWPFKTLEQQIGELEDKIAGKKAKLDCIRVTFAGLKTTTSFWVGEQANLAEQIAALVNRCERMKAKSSNAEHDRRRR